MRAPLHSRGMMEEESVAKGKNNIMSRNGVEDMKIIR
jgi:hypothetical protein